MTGAVEVSSLPHPATRAMMTTSAIARAVNVCKRMMSISFHAVDSRPGAPAGLGHEEDHDRFLDVQPVFGLVEHHRVRSVHDLIGDLFPPFGREAVHHQTVWRRLFQERAVNLVLFE